MERKAFDGRVTFDITGNNMRMLVVDAAFKRAVPEWITFEAGSNEQRMFTNVIMFLARTKRIIPMVDETDPDILDMLEFWAFSETSADYRAIWRAFSFLSMHVNDEWVGVMIEDERLKAPPEVRPNALSDDELESVAPEKKRGGKHT